MVRALKSYANARSPIRYNNGSLEIDSVVVSEVERQTSLSRSTLGHPCPAESQSGEQNSTPEALKWLRSESYASLIRRSLPASSATFEFMSPTAFRQLDHLYLFPEPATLFRGLLSRWNALAPVSLPDTLVQAARDKVHVTRFNLRTVPVGMAKLTAVGFLGECTFDLSACSVEEKREFSALARFAFYSGVGLKTAMGLGQCLVK
jgi:CRISPR-associated endoribonuclease Cas6